MQNLLTKGIDENGVIRSEATHQFKDSPLGRIPVEFRRLGCRLFGNPTFPSLPAFVGLTMKPSTHPTRASLFVRDE
jgi:hypothetical protein